MDDHHGSSSNQIATIPQPDFVSTTDGRVFQNPSPVQIVLAPSRPPPSSVSSIEQAKRYLRSLPPRPSHDYYQFSMDDLFRDVFTFKMRHDARLFTGCESEPASPRRGAEAIPQCFPLLLSVLGYFDYYGISRPIPKAKDHLSTFIPSHSFPLMDERRLKHHPYRSLEFPSHEE